MEACANTEDKVPSPRTAEWAVPGVRIRIGEHFKATIRYVGSVDGQEGCWVGLEWDDISRGKHDGCYKGKRYFTCACAGPVGSFVRYNALKEQVCQGISIEDAIRMKYKNSMDSLPHETTVVGAADVESILCQDGALEVVGLEGMSISTCVMCPSVLGFMRNIKNLDLSENLLSSWNDVAACISSLPNLKSVNLSRNVMHCSDKVIENGSCGHIQTLALNHCLIDSQDVIRWIGRVFPNVKELYVYDNHIPLDGWGEAGLPLPLLEKLDLGSNKINSWITVVESLGRLRNLRYLSLEDNTIERVNHEMITPSQEPFEKLHHLNLGKNALNDWTALEEISKMKSISELRFSGNPLCSDDASRDRLVAIGRMTSLSWINGSDVSPSERRDCELAFLRRLDSYVEGSLSLLLETRIQELEDKYSVSRSSSGHADSTASLGSKMMHIRLHYESRIVTKKVPTSLTIDKLKRVIQKLLGIRMEHQALTLRRDESLSEVISHDGSKELSFFGMEQNTWDILIEKSENHLDTERLNRRKSHDAKIEHQEQEARILAGEQHRLMQLR